LEVKYVFPNTFQSIVIFSIL